MASFASAVIVTTTAAASRSADSLSFPFLARPQAMTIYARFVDMGFSLVSDGRICSIGPASFVPTHFLVQVLAGTYRIFHAPVAVATGVSSNVAVGTVGDTVELAAQLYADGSVQIHRSYNGGAVTSGTRSAAVGLAQTWGAQQLDIAKGTGISASSHLPLRNLKIVRGVFDLPTMRRKAGV